MPAKSKAQQRLFAAAEHGATFAAARKLRGSLSHAQLHDFAVGSMKGKPEHIRKKPGTKIRTTAARIAATSKKHLAHPHRNLGSWLHPPKGRAY